MAAQAEGVGYAAMWGIVSAFSLIVGAGIGLVRQPGKAAGAAILAFGGGALLEALSIELFGHILHLQDEWGIVIIIVAVAAAIFGGCFFSALGKWLSQQSGGFAKNRVGLKSLRKSLRKAWRRKLVQRLRMVPMFHLLSEADLAVLAGKMQRASYHAKQPVYVASDGQMSKSADGEPSVDSVYRTLYFIIQGTVRVTLTHDGTMEKQHFELGKDVTFGDLAILTGLASGSEAIALGDAHGGRTKLLRIDRLDLERWIRSNPRAEAALRDQEYRVSQPDESYRTSESDLISTGSRRTSESDLISTPTTDDACHCQPSFTGQLSERLFKTSSAKVAPSIPSSIMPHSRRSAVEDATPRSRRNTKERAEGDGNAEVGSGISYVRVEPMGEAEVVEDLQVEGFEALAQQAAEQQARGEGPGARPMAERPLDPLELPPPAACLSLYHSHKGYPTLADYGWTPCTEAAADFKRVRRAPFTARAMTASAATIAAASVASATRSSKTSASGKGDAAGNGGNNVKVSREKLMSLLDHRDDGEEPGDEPSQHEMALMEAHLMESHGKGAEKMAALMIWLGILIDAVPESLVLGILANSGDVASLITFTVGVFIANFPEALSSSAILHACGIQPRTIIVMWSVITLGTGVGAALGAVAFPQTDHPSEARVLAVAAIEGLCGGAMLTMIASSVLPEAFEQHHDVAGLSCTLGFLCAMMVKAIGSEMQRSTLDAAYNSSLPAMGSLG